MRLDETSEKLATAASRGDGRAIASLYEKFLPQFRAFVSLQMGKRIRARETPTDIVQSVFGEVLEDLSGFSYRGEAAFRRWLFTRGLHKIMVRCRFHAAQKRDVAREVEPAPAPSEEEATVLSDCYATLCTPSRVAMGREGLIRTERAFDELPEEYRDVILQIRVMGLTADEVAAESGRTPSAVRAMLHRAIGRLAGILGRDPG